MALKLYKLSQNENNSYDTFSTWCGKLEDVKCEYIGEAADNINKGVVLASFNAG